ncbi:MULTISPECIES: hypothetical protein [unclassified Burkholderia]|uniref:hypothetical protein n=1 Tax=unclassified Burkholderia TaxID=2613784 RepID=UPI000AAE37E1|nr:MULTISPECIES: hypothetical protein [unclassified Burkholderia]
MDATRVTVEGGVTQLDSMPWCAGEPLLDVLETLPVAMAAGSCEHPGRHSESELERAVR